MNAEVASTFILARTKFLAWERRQALQCQCGGESPYADQGVGEPFGICPRFTCSRCLRMTPWCWGGSDSNLCDECWCAVTQGGQRKLPWRWSIENRFRAGRRAE